MKNGIKTLQNTCAASKRILRGKFIIVQVFLKKQTNKKSNKQSNLLPKRIRKKNKAKIHQEEMNNKD